MRLRHKRKAGKEVCFLFVCILPIGFETDGASIAAVCTQYEVPFAVIRAISDKTDGNAHDSVETMGDLAADNSSRLVMRMLDTMKQ